MQMRKVAILFVEESTFKGCKGELNVFHHELDGKRVILKGEDAKNISEGK